MSLPEPRTDGTCRQCATTVVEDPEKVCYKCESESITWGKVTGLNRDQEDKFK